MDITQYINFILCWLGVMAIIFVALLLAKKFGNKDSEATVDPKEYAENFEAQFENTADEKPIKKNLRSPFFLSNDEINETLEQTEKAQNKSE